MIDFFPTRHISSSNRRKFGICDRPAPAAEKAYIAERQGQDWIAAVDNYPQVKVNFVPEFRFSPKITAGSTNYSIFILFSILSI